MDEYIGIRKRKNPLEGFFGIEAKVSPFADNRSAERAYGRAERLAAALHLLTSHMHHEEPLRLAVRREALFLLEKVLAVRDEMRAVGSERLINLKASLRLIVSLVRMLAVAGSISSQNAGIVIEALDDLDAFVTSSQRSVLSESVTFLKEDFELSRSPIGGDRWVRENAIKDIKDTHNVKDIGKMSIKTMSDMSTRRQSILEILRTGGELGIRDIASNIPQYSEKTVQRELAELVSHGVIKKIGLKRWSRYVLM
jgi:hypothetical protein